MWLRSEPCLLKVSWAPGAEPCLESVARLGVLASKAAAVGAFTCEPAITRSCTSGASQLCEAQIVTIEQGCSCLFGPFAVTEDKRNGLHLRKCVILRSTISVSDPRADASAAWEQSRDHETRQQDKR